MMEKHWRFIDLLNNGAPTLYMFFLYKTTFHHIVRAERAQHII
jgi:hypothetical protein